MATNQGSEKPTEQEAGELLKVPGGNEKNRSRSPSPTSGLSNAQEFMLATQMSRFELLKEMAEQTSAFQPRSLYQAETKMDTINGLWEAFVQDHATMGAACRSAFWNHPYLASKYYEKAYRFYDQARLNISSLTEELRAELPSSTPPRTAHHSSSKLPEIKLPQFSGNYSDWPTYRDLFKALIISNAQLSNVERLQYLKTSTSGEAAQLISNIRVQEDQFKPAWGKIMDRYEDKRRLIMSHVESLCSTKDQAKTTAKELYALTSSFGDKVDALNALGVPVEHWDYILQHLLTQRIEPTLRESWEIHWKQSGREPSYSDLLDFIQVRAHALEASTHSKESTSKPMHRQPLAPSRPKSSYHLSTTQHSTHSSTQPRSAQYPCDYCGDDHYIVSCPKFRDLTPELRHKAVVAQKLCFNCFGHHNLNACNSPRTCKTCGFKHHTMIHVASPKVAAQPSTSKSPN